MWNASKVVNGLNHMDSFKPYVAQVADDGISILLNDGNGHFAKLEPWDSDDGEFWVSAECYEMKKTGDLNKVKLPDNFDCFGQRDWGFSFPDYVKIRLNECFN